ncbi:uncharacterized protein LOC133517631 [Cydia pomonella]|uniref:uncharacterized protein LOC133517631 n=1 Tax=Cydia pomonella TaxID=82600 RepID=UPI002ADD9928|nr:uncharacterized protein LOC133517631 [Cydia pomonella]
MLGLIFLWHVVGLIAFEETRFLFEALSMRNKSAPVTSASCRARAASAPDQTHNTENGSSAACEAPCKHRGKLLPQLPRTGARDDRVTSVQACSLLCLLIYFYKVL